MLYEEKIKENKADFIAGVRDISQKLGIVPEWLMQVFMNESSMNHRAVNPITKATGLIQFMPATAANLGTSIEALKTMSNVQQLFYVQKYLQPYRGKINSYQDLYFAIFFPLAINKADNWILQTSSLAASKIAQQNATYDLNKDGILTVAEVRQAILKKVPANWRYFFDKKKQ